jgi:hypothetical protein
MAGLDKTPTAGELSAIEEADRDIEAISANEAECASAANKTQNGHTQKLKHKMMERIMVI